MNDLFLGGLAVGFGIGIGMRLLYDILFNSRGHKYKLVKTWNIRSGIDNSLLGEEKIYQCSKCLKTKKIRY